MKNSSIKKWLALGTAGLTTMAAATALADQPAAAPKPDRSYVGTVISVDPQEHVVSVKAWPMRHQKFNLGDNCTYTLLDKNNGTANDLRPGEKITVNYQTSQGVLIADRIEQLPVRFEGVVATIDSGKHSLTLYRRGLDKELAIADGCIVMLRNKTPGTLADIHAGDHVTVTYETPGGMPTAREVAETCMAFTGTLTAIDLGAKTVKARALFETKKFIVANNCAIVINGKAGGKLSDLKPNDKLVFNYDPIKGVNVVNRIGLVQAEPQAKTNMMTTAPGYAGNPMGY